MRRIIFATNNENKVQEIRVILGHLFEIVSLKDLGILTDIPEPYDTLEENATEKANKVFEMVGDNCFSEDTGLEVDVLHGEPGVKSARYAGEERNAARNTHKLLEALQGIERRNARFRTIISLIFNGEEKLFEGVCEGKIAEGPKGQLGFGYDSIFIPTGSDETFAEMSLENKNKFSHRKKAVQKMASFLSQIGNK